MRISIEDFKTVFRAYCAAKQIGEARASTIVLKGGHRFADIEAGGNIGILTLQRAIQFMSDDWPDWDRRAKWPSSFPRPRKSPEMQTESALAR
jgi:hypothetical protein